MIKIRPIKFIHISDLHLNLKDADDKNAKAMKIFEDVIERCFAEEIDMLLISGDLFDNMDIPVELYNKVVSDFESIPNTNIFIAPGDHDDVKNTYLYEFNMLPKNVHIFNKDNLSDVIYRENIHIIGASNEYVLNKDTLSDALRYKGDDFNILMLHNPLNLEYKIGYEENLEDIIYKQPLHYCAFGHIHKFRGFSSIGNCIIAHPGSPYGIENNNSNRGYILGIIEDGLLEVSFEISERMKINRE